jgi:hypothetical protein
MGNWLGSAKVSEFGVVNEMTNQEDESLFGAGLGDGERTWHFGFISSS